MGFLVTAHDSARLFFSCFALAHSLLQGLMCVIEPAPAHCCRHAGLTRVIVPARNMREVAAEVPRSALGALEVLPAERLEDVLRAAFDPPYLLLPRPRI